MMTFRWGRLLVLGSVLAGLGADKPTSKPSIERPAFEMTKALVCKSVEGFEKYEEQTDASVTSDDKLLVYFRPLHYRVDPLEKPRPGHRYKAGFREDFKVRRKGDKAVLSKKDKFLEYDPTFDVIDERIYLVNHIGLKALTPGEYELDIVLFDALEEGVSASQTVSFTIVASPAESAGSTSKTEKADGPKSPPAPVRDDKKSKKSKAKP